MHVRAAVLMTLAVLAAPAGAQEARTLVTACELVNDKTLCLSSRKQFLSWYPRALKGDYQGQRNVSFCLSTGCDDAVEKDAIAGCAWRMVLKAARDRRYDAGDKQSFAAYCGDSRIDTSERADAARITQALFVKIYRRPLQLDDLSRP